MDDYQYDCASAEFGELARVICDLFPEQTRFAERADEAGRLLSVHWLSMRFGATPRKTTLDVRFTSAALRRYLALKPMQRARSHAVLRAYVEATLGSLEERHAAGETVPRETTLELGDEFA
ncbi:DUF3022 domain-containing protein [Burkholderia pseudomallei]|uniref:DUF3022 domain-containing protein n=1 Tax=Burkholderia pseudomallei TaxID=28450 RepID=UPI00030DEA27|nr:DUF3022 domain-containing protein [Burkholderia pseudomallei]AIP10851.1 hypothetical protein DP55_203 [Burkholderia pseudomallei]OMW32506.1 hypothetical protein AQ807_09425 [Burkholderia pseudomallei]ONA22966.1 hypothetical protein AQ879_18225 [Burkholderia pseudomallei]ONA33758.1 hypothetical protein AQ880_07480 [Burkholderia pseudomallei]ONA37682.1 hypothetical protein AQ881_20870 [Burkholderia pseudomallei]